MTPSHYNRAAAFNPERIVTALPAGLLSTDKPGTEVGCCQKQTSLPCVPQDKMLKGDFFHRTSDPLAFWAVRVLEGTIPSTLSLPPVHPLDVYRAIRFSLPPAARRHSSKFTSSSSGAFREGRRQNQNVSCHRDLNPQTPATHYRTLE